MQPYRPMSSGSGDQHRHSQVSSKGEMAAHRRTNGHRPRTRRSALFRVTSGEEHHHAKRSHLHRNGCNKCGRPRDQQTSPPSWADLVIPERRTPTKEKTGAPYGPTCPGALPFSANGPLANWYCFQIFVGVRAVPGQFGCVSPVY